MRYLVLKILWQKIRWCNYNLISMHSLRSVDFFLFETYAPWCFTSSRQNGITIVPSQGQPWSLDWKQLIIVKWCYQRGQESKHGMLVSCHTLHIQTVTTGQVFSVQVMFIRTDVKYNKESN